MSESPANKEQARVLLVEDNKINRLVAMQMLKRADVEGNEAESGERALELLRESRYDLVLMDVQMPGMDGLEAARAIRRGDAGPLNQQVPIIAMTAFTSAEDEQACYDAGMTGYLSKPLGLDLFLDTIDSALKD
jgi:CheY-like chemotaxis protein